MHASAYTGADRISIHAAREGGDVHRQRSRTPRPSFQSTPPVKAATPVFVSVSECLSISIHAAREGGDHNS